MTPPAALLDVVKTGSIVFLAALLQVTVFTSVDIGSGTPDLLLVTLVAVALLRGAIYGAGAGFFAGLVVDTATLETLGLTSLLLTLAGYWIGRYGETARRVAARPAEPTAPALSAVQPTRAASARTPLLSVLVATVLYAAAAFALHFMLGDDVSARLVLFDALVPAIALNLVLTPPVYALCRRALRPSEAAVRAREVRLLG